jgi:hypothetical protein
MKNISEQYGLIYGFKKRTRENIWNYLDMLADAPLVYSRHLTGLNPYLQDNPIYLYINPYCLVLVCLDCCGSMEELADEEYFNDEPPRYFTQSSSRISPVWHLMQTMLLLQRRLRDKKLSYHLRGVLLTESKLINYKDMPPVWEEMGITVYDRFENLAARTVPVNTNEDLHFGTAAMKVIEDLVTQSENSFHESEEDEFTRMLNEFLADKPGKKEEEAVEEEGEKEVEEEEEEEEEEDLSVDVPSGVIEQNNNLTVNVEILPPLKNPRKELDKLVGCQNIKARLEELLAMTRYNKMLRETFPSAKVHELSLHSIFFGRPGTGKTTVCKIFGSLLREAGALSKGHVVVANRSTFIGTLWGDEERSVNQIIEKAQGGVLMIDEAYLLNSKNDHDPGKMVIQLLMEVLADEKQRDIAVVLCGYKEPMTRLLDTNPGLHSRFPNRFEFNDFTVDELVEISLRRIDEYKYHFTRQALQKYRNVLTEAYRVRDPQSWGNARFVANQLERIYIQHANRCTKGKNISGKQLLTLTPSDIVPIDVPRPKPHLGF